MSILIKWVFKTVLGRWVTGISVALLLSGGAWKWHAFKENLIHQGQQVCVQEINKQTVIDLQDALAAERVTATELRALATAAAEENRLARVRRRDLESKVTSLETAMANQARTDNVYKKWASAPLPGGIAERLRNQATAGDTGAVRDDSN